MADKLAPEKRHIFLHNGEKVFEWDQTLDEVNIYINLPPNVHSKQFYCKIQSKHIELGIKGNPPFLNHDLTSPVKTDSSFWTLEDDIMHITLNKRDKGQTWASPILGQGQLDAYSTDLEQKRLMLQRFQEEVSFAFTLTIFSCVGIWMSIVLHVMMSLVYASQHPMLFWFDQFCFPSCSFSV